jgi:hypothetical protein
LLAVLVGGVAAAAISLAGEPMQVSTGGDPHRVTVQRLRMELGRSGLEIRPLRPSARAPHVVSGVAYNGPVEVGFEFQVFRSSSEATIRRLGRLRPRDFGWERPPATLYRTWVRGVLANVAYGQYELERSRLPGGYLRNDAARRRILRALDDALFRAFRPDDPYAHPLIPAD